MVRVLHQVRADVIRWIAAADEEAQAGAVEPLDPIDVANHPAAIIEGVDGVDERAVLPADP
jgi:hypothetical protein